MHTDSLLTDDAWQHVFSYLSPRDLSHVCGRACKRFMRLAKKELRFRRDTFLRTRIEQHKDDYFLVPLRAGNLLLYAKALVSMYECKAVHVENDGTNGDNIWVPISKTNTWLAVRNGGVVTVDLPDGKCTIIEVLSDFHYMRVGFDDPLLQWARDEFMDLVWTGFNINLDFLALEPGREWAPFSFYEHGRNEINPLEALARRGDGILVQHCGNRAIFPANSNTVRAILKILKFSPERARLFSVLVDNGIIDLRDRGTCIDIDVNCMNDDRLIPVICNHGLDPSIVARDCKGHRGTSMFSLWWIAKLHGANNVKRILQNCTDLSVKNEYGRNAFIASVVHFTGWYGPSGSAKIMAREWELMDVIVRAGVNINEPCLNGNGVLEEFLYMLPCFGSSYDSMMVEGKAGRMGNLHCGYLYTTMHVEQMVHLGAKILSKDPWNTNPRTREEISPYYLWFLSVNNWIYWHNKHKAEPMSEFSEDFGSQKDYEDLMRAVRSMRRALNVPSSFEIQFSGDTLLPSMMSVLLRFEPDASFDPNWDNYPGAHDPEYDV